MGDFRLEVKIDSFNAAMQEMAEKLRGTVTQEEIIRNEVQAILAKTLKGTGTATKASIYASQAGKKWTTYPKGDSGAKKYYLLNRYPDELWARLQAQLALSLEQKIAAIGWARKSWWSLGILIGRPIPGGGSEKATILGRDAASDVASSVEEGDGRIILMVENSSPLMQFTNGAQAFFSAIVGRTNFYHQNMAHGVFNDLAQVAKKYPGLQIVPSA